MSNQGQADTTIPEEATSAVQVPIIIEEDDNENLFYFLEPDLINLSQDALCKNLMKFIQVGSQKGSLQFQDIQVVILPGQDRKKITATQLYNNGSRMIDIQLFIANDHTDKATILTEKPEATIIMDKPKLAAAIFSLYFVLMTQAHPPTNRPKQQEVPAPNGRTQVRILRQRTNMAQFLILFLGLGNDAFDNVQQLASFDLERMNHKWIKNIAVTKLSGAFQNRTVLGIAGTRMLQGLSSCVGYFKVYPEDGLQHRIKVLIAHVNHQLYFSFHPFFRTPQFVAKFRSLNAEIEDIIARYVYPSYIESLVNTKKLYKYPRLQGQPALLKNVSLGSINAYRTTDELLKLEENETAYNLTQDMLNFDLINDALYATFINTKKIEKTVNAQNPDQQENPIIDLDPAVDTQPREAPVPPAAQRAASSENIVDDVSAQGDENRAL